MSSCERMGCFHVAATWAARMDSIGQYKYTGTLVSKRASSRRFMNSNNIIRLDFSFSFLKFKTC